MENRYRFDFEKLEVYKMGLEFARKVYKLMSQLPRNYSFSIGDQFRRSALSVVNNIAEGSGKISKKEKALFYRISLTSARECIPMLTILNEDKIISNDVHDELRNTCIYLCNMIGKLARNCVRCNV